MKDDCLDPRVCFITLALFKVCTSGQAPPMLKGISWIQSNICFHLGYVFFRDSLANFSKTVLKHMQHLFQQHGFAVEESCLPAVQIVDQLKTFQIQQRRPRTVSRVLYQTGMGQPSSPKGPAADLLRSQMFADVAKGRGDATPLSKLL